MGLLAIWPVWLALAVLALMLAAGSPVDDATHPGDAWWER